MGRIIWRHYKTAEHQTIYIHEKKCRYSIGKQQGAEYILSFQAVKVHLLKTLIEELLKK